MDKNQFGFSVWSANATPLPVSSPVQQGEEVDLAVIGAGLLGLSAALHAARQGWSVRVLDAGNIASGASGKNGGQVIPGLKFDPDWLIQHYGKTRGETLIDFISKTADTVFDLIKNNGLDVPNRRSGWIYAAHSAKGMQLAVSRNRQWLDRGADVRLLDMSEIAAITGARGYIGGWLDRRAGVVNPLALTQELARITLGAGGKITESESVKTLISQGDRYVLTTGSGKTVIARKVIVATNAYADGLIPHLAQSLVPLHSFQIASAPLEEEISAEILPQGQAVSDSRRILVYFRKTPDGRLMLGGRGRSGLPMREQDWAHLRRAMVRLYPVLKDVDITHRWFGRIAMTPDHLPHIHEPYPGVVTALGCQGRGVGLMTALGPRLVDFLMTGNPDEIPFVKTLISPIPFHRFRRIGISAAITFYRGLDALER